MDACRIDESGRRQCGPVPPSGRSRRVYVVRLDDAVRHAGPGTKGLPPCVYVGVSSYLPEQRFCQHKRGYKAFRKHRYMIELMPEIFESIPPVRTWDEARALENRVAIDLESRGFTVFRGPWDPTG
jgi:hypothetical protein